MSAFPEKENKNGAILLAAGKIIFGFAAIAVKILPTHYASLLLATNVCAFVGFSPAAWRQLRRLPLGAMLLAALVSLAFFATDGAYYIAVKRMDVSFATLIRWVGPVLGIILGALAGERMTLRSVIGTIVAFSGLALILLNRWSGDSADYVGILMAAFAAISIAIYWLGAKIVLRTISAAVLIWIRSLVSILLLILIIVLTARADVIANFRSNFLELALFGLIFGIIAAYPDSLGLARTKIRHALAIAYLLPLTTLIFSVAWLGEPLTWPLVIGGALILGGSLFAQTGGDKIASAP